MSYDIIAVPKFRKELKKLSKKYPSIKSDFASFLERLENNPKLGIPLGKNCYKIRLTINSKGRGKSGGARVITYIYFAKRSLYLLSIYDKSDKESISDKEILARLKDIQ